jgi:hypothetical protein
MSNNTEWTLKIVPASMTCDDTPEHMAVSSTHLPPGDFPENFNEAKFVVTLNDTFEAAGKYIVCFSEDVDFVPISSAESFYLDIGLAAATSCHRRGCT